MEEIKDERNKRDAERVEDFPETWQKLLQGSHQR